MFAADVIDASVNNIPTSYNATPGSLAINGCPSAGILVILNMTTSVIAVTVGTYPQIPVSTISSNRNQGFIPPAASTSLASGIIVDSFFITQNDKLYIRSMDSAISSGRVFIWVV